MLDLPFQVEKEGEKRIAKQGTNKKSREDAVLGYLTTLLHQQGHDLFVYLTFCISNGLHKVISL